MVVLEGVGGWERYYLSLHCHHQNDSCIKMGSDESLFLFLFSSSSFFNVALIVRSEVTSTVRVPINHKF